LFFYKIVQHFFTEQSSHCKCKDYLVQLPITERNINQISCGVLQRRDFRKTKGQMVEINETFDMQPCYGLDISFNDSVLSTFLFIIIIPNTEFITYGISECNAQNLACQSTTRTCGMQCSEMMTPKALDNLLWLVQHMQLYISTITLSQCFSRTLPH